MLEQYFKPYPICPWAQPAIDAAIGLQQQHNIAASDTSQIAVTSFEAAARLACSTPRTTEEAQYSLSFPLAAALVRGAIGIDEVGQSGIADPEILRLSNATKVQAGAEYERRFPAERWADVTFHLADGRTVRSAPAIARGNRENPLTAAEMTAKYRTLSRPVLGPARSKRLEAAIAHLDDGSGGFDELMNELFAPVDFSSAGRDASGHKPHGASPSTVY